MTFNSIDISIAKTKWRLVMNDTKPKIGHYRHKSKGQSEHLFVCGEIEIGHADKYK